MIDYDPRRWYGLLFVWRGTVLPVIVPRVLGVGLLAVLSNLYNQLVWPLKDVHHVGHLIMGLVVGYMIVLRTNTAYDRFWEGRKLWGGIVNTCRNLVREAAAHAGGVGELGNLTRAYVLALKTHLRGATDFSEVESLLPAEVYADARDSGNAPLVISYHLSRWIRRRIDEGKLDAFFGRLMEERVEELLNHQGGCERILRTPIPFNYAVHIKQFLAVYLLTLPYALTSLMNWWAVPSSMIIAFGLSGVEEAGVEVEDPFGTDANDLPLESLCGTIGRNVETLERLAGK